MVFKSILFSVLFFVSLSGYCQEPEIDLRLTPGDHLIKATNRYNVALIVSGAGLLFSFIPTLDGMASKQATPFYLIGSILGVVSFGITISGNQQFKKAGRLMNK